MKSNKEETIYESFMRVIKIMYENKAITLSNPLEDDYIGFNLVVKEHEYYIRIWFEMESNILLTGKMLYDINFPTKWLYLSENKLIKQIKTGLNNVVGKPATIEGAEIGKILDYDSETGTTKLKIDDISKFPTFANIGGSDIGIIKDFKSNL